MSHARLAPSAADRWIRCPGSLALADRLRLAGLISDEDEPSAAAETGTRAHAVLSGVLVGGDFDALVDLQPEDERVDLRRYMPRVLERIRSFGEATRTLVEEKIVIDVGAGQSTFGTVDFAHYSEPERRLVVADLKWGFIPVYAEDSTQIRLYALGLLDERLGPIDEIVLMILQPRCPATRETEVRLTVEELREWARVILAPAAANVETADRAADLVGHLDAGTHCRYCPAIAFCPAASEKMRGLLAEPPAAADDATLARLLADADVAVKAAEAIRKEALRRLRARAPLPGYKLVEGRGSRLWKDGAVQAAAVAFGAEVFKTEFMTPAQVEALPGGLDFVSTWAYMQSGSPAIVPEKDRRPALMTQLPATMPKEIQTNE